MLTLSITKMQLKYALNSVLLPSAIMTKIANNIMRISCSPYPIALRRVYTFHFYSLYAGISIIAVILHTLNTPMQQGGQLTDSIKLSAVTIFLAYRNVNLGLSLRKANGHSRMKNNIKIANMNENKLTDQFVSIFDS